ncbi:spore maturation protein [Arthrobacter sp. PGP41]|nr:spore maturation protein [Arthrobacter sp. PGP41]
MKPVRILLVSPVFHGYWNAMSTALERRGHQVTVHCYDAAGPFNQRLGNKLLHELPEKWRPAKMEQKLTDRALAALNAAGPDVVVLVKGDQLGPDWWQALDERRIPRVTWLYDELRRMRYTPEQLRNAGPIASYSRQDTESLTEQGIEARHVPLAFDDSVPVPRIREDHISFIGARYDSRENLLRELAASAVPVKAYGRTWSRHPFDVLRTRQFSSAGIPVGRDMARAEAYGVMQGSPATLNLHGDQDGFTMRTFEAAGVGALQILDRADVDSMYDVGDEVLVFESAEELVELCRRALLDGHWAQRIRMAGQRRTLEQHTFGHRIATLEELWG